MGYMPATTAGWTSQPFGSNPGGYNPPGGHTGRDRALDVGTPLVARGDGLVLHSGWLPGTWSDNPWLLVPDWAGFVVVIDYGPFLSVYAHCDGSPVKAGARVRMGQHVADSGNSGSATSGPHLHEEAMPDGWDVMNGTYGRVDPDLFGGLDYAGTTITPLEAPLETAREGIDMGKIVLATDGVSPDVWRCEAGERYKIDDMREVHVIKDLALRGVLDVFMGEAKYTVDEMIQKVWLLDALGRVKK